MEGRLPVGSTIASYLKAGGQENSAIAPLGGAWHPPSSRKGRPVLVDGPAAAELHVTGQAAALRGRPSGLAGGWSPTPALGPCQAFNPGCQLSRLS